MAQVIGGSKTPACSGADLLELVEVHRVGQLKRYSSGTLLFWQGDPVECLFLVKTGKAKTFSLSPAGKVHTYGIWGPGCLLGITAFLLGEGHKSMADVVEDADVWVIPLLEFERLLSSDPRFSLAVLREQARTVDFFVRDIDSLSFMDVHQRLKHSLVRLADEHGRATERGVKIDVDITHEEIAELTAANRCTVTAYLSDLKRQGYLWKEGRRLVIIPPTHIRILDGLSQAVLQSDDQGAVGWASKAVEEGVDPIKALDALTDGMKQVECGFAHGDLFPPDVMMAASAMKAAMCILEEKIQKTGQRAATLGTVIMGTVHGDTHDLGKTMVAALLKAAGFEVIDLGVDVAAGKFAEAVREHGPRILALSAVMTGVAQELDKVDHALKARGLRDHVKIMIGGGGVTQELAAQLGADGYEPTALGAVKLAKELIGVD